tara:strand:- start:1923 stop:2315 length:393 start_codon:yes stop_codon:yes gene_type:complete
MNIVANKFLSSLNSWEKNDFEYGTTDCCQFASHVVKSITGEDYAANFQYGSEEEARKIIEEHNGLVGLISSLLGEPNQTEKDGDVCVLFIPSIGELLGVRYKDDVVCITEKGLKAIEYKYVIAEWAICHQ